MGIFIERSGYVSVLLGTLYLTIHLVIAVFLGKKGN